MIALSKDEKQELEKYIYELEKECYNYIKHIESESQA